MCQFDFRTIATRPLEFPPLIIHWSVRGWTANRLCTAVMPSPCTVRIKRPSDGSNNSMHRGCRILPTTNRSSCGWNIAWNVDSHRPVMLSWGILFLGWIRLWSLLLLDGLWLGSTTPKCKSSKISSLLAIVVLTAYLPDGEKKTELMDRPQL